MSIDIDLSNTLYRGGPEYGSFTVGRLDAVRRVVPSSSDPQKFCVVEVQVEPAATIKIYGEYVPVNTSDDQSCARAVAVAQAAVENVR
jgi:hypothetical protein